MPRAMPPAPVSRADIVEVGLDCKPVAPDAPRLNGERYIHCQVYKARSDVQSVIHTHDLAVIPFGLAAIPLRPVLAQAGFLPPETPLFEVRDANASETKRGMLVLNAHLGDALARTLAANPVVLMRGHGETVVGRSVREATTPTSMRRRKAPPWRSVRRSPSWTMRNWRRMPQRTSTPTGRGRIINRDCLEGAEQARGTQVHRLSFKPSLSAAG
jgi:hypothetical protein